MTPDFEIGTKLQTVKTYVNSQDYMPKEIKTKVLNFINDDKDGFISNNFEKALLGKLLNGSNNKQKMMRLYTSHPDCKVSTSTYNVGNDGIGTKRTISYENKYYDITYEQEQYKAKNNAPGNVDRKSNTYSCENKLFKHKDVLFDRNADNIVDSRMYIVGRTYYHDNDLDGRFDEKIIVNKDDKFETYKRTQDGKWNMVM